MSSKSELFGRHVFQGQGYLKVMFRRSKLFRGHALDVRIALRVRVV